MKKAILSTAVVSALFAGTALAELNVDADLTLATDYRFRGISQTGTENAVQGGIKVGNSNGLHAGVWASSMESGSELDYFVGYSVDMSSVTLGAEYRYYDYSADEINDPDYDEWSLTASAKGATVGVIWSDDYVGSGVEYIRYGASYNLPVGPVTFHAHAGLNDFDQPYFVGGEDQYVDYELAAMVDVHNNVTVKVAWVGTDLDKGEVGGLDTAEDAFVLSVSAAL